MSAKLSLYALERERRGFDSLPASSKKNPQPKNKLAKRHRGGLMTIYSICYRVRRGGLIYPFTPSTMSFPARYLRNIEEYEENERCFGEGKGVKERANQNFVLLPWYVDNS